MKIIHKLTLLIVLVLIAGVVSQPIAFAQVELQAGSTSDEISMISTSEPRPWATPAPPSGLHAVVDTAATASGPDAFPADVNPLTGLQVDNPDLLDLPPALISVTNFPVSARPQAGLSFSPFVYELYIGEGMTRFLAMFYGEFPQVTTQNNGGATVTTDNKAEIGPIRSGRLPYQAIRKFYNGFLVMGGADSQVGSSISGSTNFYGSDSDDINSALLDVTQLQAIAEANATGERPNMTGNAFSTTTPAGGQAADTLWVFYNYLNQVNWVYDAGTGAYLRFQDHADGSGEFFPATDRLTGEQLAFENVIVLKARHEVLNAAGTMIDVDLMFQTGEAYLFRDGQMYPILWTTVGGEYEQSSGHLRPIRFTDLDGSPMELKPGSTWVEMMDVTATVSQQSDGSWKARFYSP